MRKLTRYIVHQNGWNKIQHITEKMLKGYDSIGESAFENCSGLTSVTIPNSVKSIGDVAFYKCTGLTSVTIPNSVTSIGDWAFCGCSGLTSITIPNSVTSIGRTTFHGCFNLTNVTIPNSIISIGNNVFAGCYSLKSMTIPNSITSIGAHAFIYCSSLKEITIGNNVTYIGLRAFYGCKFSIPLKLIDNQLVAYKGFNSKMQCREFQYLEGETYSYPGKIELCNSGFHACTNPLDIFNYYYGKINEDIFIHEVYLSGVSDERGDDSKVVAKEITIGRRLSIQDINNIINLK